MAKTADNLVTRVMQKLTNLPPGEDPSAEDNQFITESWKSINDNLRVMKVSGWTFDSIPDHVFEPLAEYVKEYLWQEYHGRREGNSEYVAAAMRRVKASVSPRYMGNAVEASYY